jgi:uncharacterized protein (TIGR02466 family)
MSGVAAPRAPDANHDYVGPQSTKVLPVDDHRCVPLPGAELIELFPMPLLKYRWPDSEALNRDLRKVIISRMEEASGKSNWYGSNIGGWHSPKDMAVWPEPCVAQLMGRIQALVREMVSRVVDKPQPEHLQGWRLCAWANVNRHGERNESHDHSGEKDTLWSGIYYVDPGDGGVPASGHTRFEDRSGVPKEVIRNPDPFEREHSITPDPGLMVIFPGKLWHRVEPFLGGGPRITVAFNLGHSGFVIPSYAPNAIWEGGLNRGMWLKFPWVMRPASFVKRRLRAVVTAISSLRILRG